MTVPSVGVLLGDGGLIYLNVSYSNRPSGSWAGPRRSVMDVRPWRLACFHGKTIKIREESLISMVRRRTFFTDHVIRFRVNSNDWVLCALPA